MSVTDHRPSAALRALVTGGGGFLGSRIVSMLLEEGYVVRSFSRNTYPDLAARGVSCVKGDLADAAVVRSAVADNDIVFHVGAKVGMWGQYRDYHSANVVGTRTILHACRLQGVRKLVYTSTPSVVFDGRHLRQATVGMAYPRKYLTHYASTKAEAERLVLEANGPELATVALRPHAIWGPGDNQVFPRLIARHRANRLRLVGRGDNVVDTTYVDNAARAHIDAARRLEPGSVVAGKAYFISQGDPRPMREILISLLDAAGLAPVEKSIPLALAYSASWLLENFYRLFRLAGEPPLTRYLVLQFARDQYFDLTDARRDLGYNPTVTIEEGIEKLRSALANAGSPAAPKALAAP